MGDIHLFAYHYSSMDSLIQHQHMTSISQCWDFYNADYSFPSATDNNNPPVFSSDFDADMSTGYLQDALVKLHDQSKRQRLFFNSDDQTRTNVVHVKSYENSNFNWDLYENMSCLSQLTTTNIIDQVSDEAKNTSVDGINEEEDVSREKCTEEEEISGHEEALYSSPDSHHHYSLNQTISSSSMLNSESSGDEKINNINMVSRRMVYPFEVVKPGGVEGDVTLNDINERIQMTPTRSIKHPVGDYACRRSVTVNGGTGLSGKAVVALTTIHTQGKGTITIIRTKG